MKRQLMEHEPLNPAQWLSARGLTEAPPPFFYQGQQVVPVDISEEALTVTADVRARRVVGHAHLRFSLAQKGRPMLDLVPEPLSVSLNSSPLPPSSLKLVKPPDTPESLRMLDYELDKQTEHELEIEYLLSNDDIVYESNGVRFAFFMSDLSQREYLEKYAPANLEFDQFSLTVNLRVIGAGEAHRLFTNGRVETVGDNEWKVTFPDYFTCSSCYLHVTNRPLAVLNRDYKGSEKTVPVLMYGEDAGSLEQAMSNAFSVLEELEATYGPYAHERLTIYLTQQMSPGAAGMEYCGATMTMSGALPHELTHSWFARGVMPANGNAGWIDEAIATWRDHGYQSVRPDPTRPPVMLAGFSPYRRYTTSAAYGAGSLLLSELDFLFRDRGGLRPMLARLFLDKRRQVITTPYFQSFLEKETGIDLSRMFARFVYGRRDAREFEVPGFMTEKVEAAIGERLRAAWGVSELVSPPRPYSHEELRKLL